MRKISQEELDQVLEQHALWLESDGGQGVRADLSHADLWRADLSGADLTYADLSHADLSRADLSRANLSWTYFRYANLTRAQIDAGSQLHQCSSFEYLTCSPGALPWLVLHPRWPDWKSTVTVVEDIEDNQK